MYINITELYPKDNKYLEIIESEKCRWLLAQLREIYSEDLIKEAINQLIDDYSIN